MGKSQTFSLEHRHLKITLQNIKAFICFLAALQLFSIIEFSIYLQSGPSSKRHTNHGF